MCLNRSLEFPASPSPGTLPKHTYIPRAPSLTTRRIVCVASYLAASTSAGPPPPPRSVPAHCKPHLDQIRPWRRMTIDSRCVFVSIAAPHAQDDWSWPEVLPLICTVPHALMQPIPRSEFFWLGLVASLFIGLTVTVFRTRNARYVQTEGSTTAARAPLVTPELWEVSIEPDAVLRTKDEVARKWAELLVRLIDCPVLLSTPEIGLTMTFGGRAAQPLSGRVTMEDPPPPPPKPDFWCAHTF